MQASRVTSVLFGLGLATLGAVVAHAQSSQILPSYPKLAGQHADYLYVALKAYQTEGNPQVGRGNAIMGGMAKPFSHAELKQIASYIATLPTDLKTVPESRFR